MRRPGKSLPDGVCKPVRNVSGTFPSRHYSRKAATEYSLGRQPQDIRNSVHIRPVGAEEIPAPCMRPFRADTLVDALKPGVRTPGCIPLPLCGMFFLPLLRMGTQTGRKAWERVQRQLGEKQELCLQVRFQADRSGARKSQDAHFRFSFFPWATQSLRYKLIRFW